MKIKDIKNLGIVFSILIVVLTLITFFVFGRFNREFSKSLVFEFEISENIQDLKVFENISKSITLSSEIEVSSRDNATLLIKTPLLSTEIAENLINSIDAEIQKNVIPQIEDLDETSSNNDENIIETVQEFDKENNVYYDRQNATTTITDANGNLVEGEEAEKIMENIEGAIPIYKENPLNISDEVYEKTVGIRMIDEGSFNINFVMNESIAVFSGILISWIFLTIKYKDICGAKLFLVQIVNLIFAVLIGVLSVTISNVAIGYNVVLESLFNIMYITFASVSIYEAYRRNILSLEVKDIDEEHINKVISDVTPKVKGTIEVLLFIGLAIALTSMLENYLVVEQYLLPIVISTILLEITAFVVTLPLIYKFSQKKIGNK